MTAAYYFDCSKCEKLQKPATQTGRTAWMCSDCSLLPASFQFYSINNIQPSLIWVAFKNIPNVDAATGKALNQQEKLSTLSANTTRLTFPLYAVKAAHLPIKLITCEILLITDCIRTRLTFPFPPLWRARLEISHYKRVCFQEQVKSHLDGVKGVAGTSH